MWPIGSQSGDQTSETRRISALQRLTPWICLISSVLAPQRPIFRHFRSFLVWLLIWQGTYFTHPQVWISGAARDLDGIQACTSTVRRTLL